MNYRFGLKRLNVKRAATALLLVAIAVPAWMYHVATSDPIVRSTALAADGLAAPVRLVLVSDIHVAGPDMPPRRVRRIVDQINRLRPDVVLIAGDLVSDKRTATRQYSAAEAIAPLAGLKARLGVVAVLGNHDHWRAANAIARELRRANVQVLNNEAARVGLLTIGGVDDAFTGHHDLGRTLQLMRSNPHPRILLTHSADVFLDVPAEVVLTLAGHTHCGQIRLPLIGAVSTMSDYGERYACGRIDENGRTLVVSAGVGTSVLPLRLGAVPDIWVVDLHPK